MFQHPFPLLSAPVGFRRVAAFDPALISLRHNEDVAITTILEEDGAIGDIIGLAVAVKHDAAAFGNFAETICQFCER
jgi:hypothetical protein